MFSCESGPQQQKNSPSLSLANDALFVFHETAYFVDTCVLSRLLRLYVLHKFSHFLCFTEWHAVHCVSRVMFIDEVVAKFSYLLTVVY
jgi:hypothetical protein